MSVRRRLFLGTSLLCAALITGIASAADPAPTPAKGPWIGVWKLNVAKSKYQGNPPPADAIRIYEMRLTGPDTFDVIIDFKDPKDPTGPSTVHMETRGAKFDGKEYKEVGNPVADINRFQVVNERSYQFIETKGVKEVIRITVEISEDGKTRTSRQSSQGPDGKQITNIAVWDKQ